MAQRGIRISDFPIVEPPLIFFGIRCRRLIGIVWIIKMHPDKIRTSALTAEPLLSPLRYVDAATLDSSPARFAFSMFREVIVELESTIQSGRQLLAVKNYSANKVRGRISLL